MPDTFRAACIQNCAGNNQAVNLERADALIRAASANGADFITLPEYFACIEPNDAVLLANAADEVDHAALAMVRSLARELSRWMLIGAIPVRCAPDRVNNRSYLISDRGDIVARYNKIHLFDVELREGERYDESATVVPGEEAVVAELPWARLGMTVCYDLRFPELYRQLALAGADMLSVPSAFTKTTGRVHWEVLLRARAIETGSFVIAPAQYGVRPWGRATWGHSLIVDPWGTVLADGGDGEGFVCADIDVAAVEQSRRRLPNLRHQRAFTHPA
jgi:deaminated glutathione amidase